MAKILVIENKGFIKIKLEKTLREYGYSDTAFLGSYQVYQNQYSTAIKDATLIFIDCDNHETDPSKIIPTVTSLASSKAVIVSITSKADKNNISKLLSLGSRDILVKPYSDIKLMEKVFKSLGKPTLKTTSPVVNDVSSDKKDSKKGRYMPKWSEDLELGIDIIDHDHKSLIEAYETLYQKFQKGGGHDYCLELLSYLNDYVVTHFDHEESFLQDIEYPDLDSHKTMHNQFTGQVDDITKLFDSKEISNEMLIRFSLFIKNWWIHHILVDDKKYIDFHLETKEKN